MSDLLGLVASEERLLGAWEEVRDNALEDGVAGEEVDAFERRSASHVARISRQLLDNTWQPAPVTHVRIAKAGGFRNLGVPRVEDRVVERSVMEVLDELVDPLLMPWSVAYRRGMGIQTGIRQLVEARDCGSTWVARCDVKDCFERIPRAGALARLYATCPDPALFDLVRRLVHRPVAGRHAPRLARGRGLHQGSPLSPLLANLYLDAFDRALAAAGLTAIRYADDVAIPVRSRAEGERALVLAREALRDLDLELNDTKSDVVSFDEGVEFLGQTITPQVGVWSGLLDHPLEATVYVTTQGALLRTRGDRMVVEHNDERAPGLLGDDPASRLPPGAAALEGDRVPR